MEKVYESLESELARWIGVEDVAVCSSGTAALHLAIESFQFPNRRRDAEIIVPDYAMVACALAVDMADMVPVCIDCTDDLLIDPDFRKKNHFPFGCAIPNSHITLSEDFSNDILNFLIFCTGRTISEEKPRDNFTEDWSKMIWDLLNIVFRIKCSAE